MKTVLITGATSGIGQQLALDYAAADWQVLACGRNTDKLQALQQRSDRIDTLAFDITDQQQVLAVGKTITQPLDLVILNAGTCEYIDDARQFDSSLLERVMRSNVLGTAYCLEAFTRHIPAGGQLALMGSSASFFPFPRAEAYGASKAAIAYLAQTLAVDLHPQQIAVSLISPGFVETPLTAKNDFAMPMKITVTDASTAIRAGLAKRQQHIAIPRLFTTLLALLGKLPNTLQHYLALKMVKS